MVGPFESTKMKRKFGSKKTKRKFWMSYEGKLCRVCKIDADLILAWIQFKNGNCQIVFWSDIAFLRERQQNFHKAGDQLPISNRLPKLFDEARYIKPAPQAEIDIDEWLKSL